MSAKYIVGIDLGTTNSVAAYAALEVEQPHVELLSIPQPVAPNTIEARTKLPSFLYLAAAAETKSGALDLPWATGREYAVGEHARRQGASVPERTVSAAKSWLCHTKVDRRQPILPWGAGGEVPKVSPVTASQRYLEHIAGAWEAAFPDAPLGEQQVVLTVPASFDASARELTREAALAAGLPDTLILLEEPQAAVYAWLGEQGDKWRKALKLGDLLLVCDVGGGTTDLTLVGVAEEGGELVLKRIAVGNHLLVGGDNMDLALAHHAASLFAEKGTQLDPWQSVALWHACRTAKESLLSADGPKKHPISIPGRGSKLIGGLVSVDVDKKRVQDLLVDGFFPACGADEAPIRSRTSGFQEIGLPFEHDTAITRHVAAFLQAHSDDDVPLRPTHILFNGGVFQSEALRTRLLEVVGSWYGKKEGPKTLSAAPDLDHAVARGAALYGWTKERGGVRIRGGAARAYYVGIETSGPAIPGAPRPLRALCVVPIGMEEGTETDVPSEAIGLVVGEAAHFRFFSSPVRKQDRPGALVANWAPEEISETDSLETLLPATGKKDEGYVPVKFHSRVTELGMFELACVSQKSDERWKLEFSIREDAESVPGKKKR